jgi:glycosyltransferase involved in cell wall biosynthesis
MIGIGITTYNRDELLLKCLMKIQSHTKSEHMIYVASDSDLDRRGVAYRKNECLQNLKGCDYIFLFDDDCYPNKDGWDQYIIEVAKKTGNNHFCYNKEPFCKIKQSMIIKGESIDCFDASGGVLLFYTKEVITKVGAFYSGYDRYGYEHIGHSIRIFKAGLTCDFFPCPENMSEYIYSLDYENLGFFINNSTLPKDEKILLTEHNKKVWREQDQEIYIPIQQYD